MLLPWSLEEELPQTRPETNMKPGAGQCSTEPSFGKLGLSRPERGSVGENQRTLIKEPDHELLYVNACSAAPEGYQVVVQGTAEVPAISELFYGQVLDSHSRQLVKNCFYHLRNISKLRALLTKADLDMIIHAFSSSCLDCYCC